MALGLLPPFVGRRATSCRPRDERPGGLRHVGEILRGYLLVPVIAGLLLFLAGVGIVRKVRSRRHRWSDVHVPIVVKPGGYDQLVADLHDAVASADLPTDAADAPWVLTLPAWLLTSVAGGNVRKLRPDRLVELTGRDLRVGVYPSDIAISGTTRGPTRARIADPEPPRDDVRAPDDERRGAGGRGPARKRSQRPPVPPAGMGRAPARDAFAAIDARLLDLAVPTDEWDILYRLRLQIERDLAHRGRARTTFPGPRRARRAGGPGPAGRPPAGPWRPRGPRRDRRAA